MAQPLLISARVRYRLTPWWVKVLAIWVASRVISTSLLSLFANWQEANYWTGKSPGYFDFAQLWDSGWYHVVAVSGYPSVLPMTSSGHVGENAWAFLPGYPVLVRFLMIVTTLPWAPLSVFVSVAFSLGTALMLFKLMRHVLPSSTALFTVVLFCVAPLSPILQVSYAESMYAFLLTLALYLLLERRYVLLLPVMALMSLTRPSGLAFALTLGLHVIYRWFTRRRDPFPLAERILVLGVTAFSLLCGFAWTLIAWSVTGVPSAYTDTELAWRASYIGHQGLIPFLPWFQAAEFWGIQWHLGGFAFALLALLIVLFAAALFTPSVRRLGVDLRLWSASYAVYLFAVFFPQSSVFRLLIPLFPLLGGVAQPRSRIYRTVIVLLSIAGQYGWIYICWWSNGYDWTPP